MNNTTLNPGVGGDTIANEDIAGVKYQFIKLVDSSAGVTTPIGTSTNPLRFDPTGTTAQAVTGTFWQATQPVSGPLTDAQLRAVGVPVTGTFFQATQPISIAGTVTVNGSAVTQPVSAASLPLPTGASTETTLAALNTKVTAVNTGAVVLAAGAASIGTVLDGGSGKTIKSAVISQSATGTVVAAVAGKRIKVFAIKVICSAAISINFRDGATTALEGVQSIAINGGYTESVNPPYFVLGTTAGNSLDLVITGVGTAAGRVTYWDDDGT